jgi:threonine dehydrogenase-like Zn-dependent dehydrogenase
MTDIPTTQYAIQFVGVDEVTLNRSKPVIEPGPRQVLVRVEAVGICFSDTKLLHAWTSHPRKGPVVTGMDEATLAEIPSYVPGEIPAVPGHECCARIVAVGEDVRRHRVGERVLVQTDYRHLMTSETNAAFGYNFEGGLQDYVLMDERVIIEPGTDERFLIPVSEEPSASAVALLEPWACVERAYASEERSSLTPGGSLLVVAEAGHHIDGLASLVATADPQRITAVVADASQRSALGVELGSREQDVIYATDSRDLPAGSFDDVVYFGADAERAEGLQDLLAYKGVLDIVLGGRRLGRSVEIDIGRVHYELIRWIGTIGASAADGYAWVPPVTELRDGDRVAIIGAAGPMGFMHVIRSLTLGRSDLEVTAIDIDQPRLAHLARVAGQLTEERGAAFETIDSTAAESGSDYTHVGVMVPVPAIAAGAVEMVAEGGLVDIFAGFAVGTRAAIDLDALIEKRIFLYGTSGSIVPDMKAVLGRLEAGTLDTNISVYAISGIEGVADALAAVKGRTTNGKIVIYPELHSVGLIRLADMAEHFPRVAAALDDGRWTRAAEEALLGAAGAKEGVEGRS